MAQDLYKMTSTAWLAHGRAELLVILNFSIFHVSQNAFSKRPPPLQRLDGCFSTNTSIYKTHA
jgi:hypothetical protein